MAAGIALVGPVSLDALRDLIPPQAWRDDVPRDSGATVIPALARALLGHSRRVTIISYAIGLPEEVVIDAGPLRLCIGPGRRQGRARDFFSAERGYLAAALARERPALIHAHWTYEFAMAAQAAGAPCLITAHDAPLAILRHDPSPYRFMRTAMAYAVLHHADRIIAVSPHIERHLRRWIGFRGECTVIPNGIDEKLFQAAAVCRQRQPVFACVMNGWGRLKNPHPLLRAFASLRHDLPQSRLLMIGDGYGVDGPAARWAASQGITDGVAFIGMLPHDTLLDQLRSAVDILVHPSLEESQGMAVVEAMASGIPVIGGSDSGAIPWVLDRGGAGLLTDVRSAAALAGAMRDLARDPARRLHLAESGLARAMQLSGMKAIAARHAAIYTELCGSAWR